MNNPLVGNLVFSAPQLSFSFALDTILALCSFGFIVHSFLKNKSNFARPAFILASFVFLLYQLPLVIFSSLFYQNLPNATWFAVSIHASVICNLLWVYFTPRLNYHGFNNTKTYNTRYFRGALFWFPVLVFFLLIALYLQKIPFFCTALYALFVDSEITLLVREMVGKLLGGSYAPHILNVLTSATCPISAFLLIGRIYYDYKEKTYKLIPVWFFLLFIILLTPLLGGAKGSLVPMAVAAAVVGFLVAKSWKGKIFTVSLLIALFISAIFLVKIAQESSSGNGQYQFGQCVARLKTCEKTNILLESLRAKPYYGVSKERIDSLSDEVSASCNIPKTDSDVRKTEIEVGKKSLLEHLLVLVDRIFFNPIQVVSWHFLYVSEHGAPNIYGLSIVKLFSDKYINVPSKVCELYYTGDKTSACTAPTSYLFTYPAYLGFSGLLLAAILTIAFDVIFSLLIKYSVPSFSALTVGIAFVAITNLLVSDFFTVIISHGVGVAAIMLVAMGYYARRLSNYSSPC